MRRMISVLLVLTLLLGFAVPVMATEPEKSDDIVILYTNDVHTYIDGALSYDVIAAMKQELQEDYNHVLLVDAGDHIQGTAYGSMDKGKTIIDLMNAAGYDLATLGNHEFDYGMEGRINVTDVWAEYPYVSCNFYYEEAGVRGENVLDSYRIFNCGDVDIALVGITTPSTFTSTTPAYFQDEDGNYIYGIAGGGDGSALYADVQGAIDAAVDEGAEIVIALGHLGVELAGDPWGSEATIANVTGLDAFIDGHSHTVMEGETVSDQDGNPVLLTQTGQYFDRIGMMVIDAETGAIETDLIEYDEAAGTLSSDLYSDTRVPSDSAVGEIKGAWMTAVNDLLGTKIGTAEITLDNYDENGNRLVRSQETNSGDFSADALYYLFDDIGMDVDFAVMNGGGVRNGPIKGDLSYLSCKEIHTFGNVACLLTVTGQQMLDALEWGARSVGAGEEGSFLHVSGLKYKVDTSLADTTRQDDKGVWTGAPDAYRVYDVMVYNKETDGWDPLDLSKEYNLAGYNYTLRDLGGGFAMFDGAVNVLDYVMEDYMVLANYVSAFEDCNVGADNSPLLKKYPGFLLDYGNLYGSGRICSDLDGDHYCDGCWELLTDCMDEDHDHICDICGEAHGFTDVDVGAWYCEAVDYVQEKGLMIGTGEGIFAPAAPTNRAMLVTVLWRLEGEPQPETTGSFTDVERGSWYEQAVEWAAANGIVLGIGDDKFAPDGDLTREQAAVILYRYGTYREGDTSDSASLMEFPDGEEVSPWAQEAMEWAVATGLIIGEPRGEELYLSPRDGCNRAELATLFMRFAEMVAFW